MVRRESSGRGGESERLRFHFSKDEDRGWVGGINIFPDRRFFPDGSRMLMAKEMVRSLKVVG